MTDAVNDTVDSVWSRSGGTVRWQLAGRLDALSATTAREEIAAADLGGVGLVVADLRELVFVDSAGLAALVRLLRRCEAAAVPLRTALPTSLEAFRIFQLTQFDRVFEATQPGDLDADVPGART